MKANVFWFFLLLVAVWEVLSEADRKASNERLRVLEERVDDLERD